MLLQLSVINPGNGPVRGDERHHRETSTPVRNSGSIGGRFSDSRARLAPRSSSITFDSLFRPWTMARRMATVVGPGARG